MQAEGSIGLDRSGDGRPTYKKVASVMDEFEQP